VAVFDARLSPDPAGVARLLDDCPKVGISVIWLADNSAEIPRQASEILVTRHAPGAALVGTVWSTDPDVADREIDVEQLRSDVADRVARALAPIRDASTASLATSIPRTAPLLDVLGVGKPSPQWIAE
jgi:S-DNA-T family DNA segregation ATPase FtsK/SpoIIIE